MEGSFQKSWSVYGYKTSINNIQNDNFSRNRPGFQSSRSTRANLQQRFGHSTNNNENLYNPRPINIPGPTQFSEFVENECPFYLKPQTQTGHGLRFRSLTDSNIRQFEVNGVTKSCNDYQSPKGHRQSFRHLPERIGPILNNIQNTVSQACPKTEKFLQKGGEKVQKAIRGVRTSINSFSQHFKKATRRRYQLDNSPTQTPNRTPARITPGKLYSPFDVNTPRTPHSYLRGPKRLQHGQNRRIMHAHGQENFAMCRTPQNHDQHPSPARFNNWVEFNSSPAAARPYRQDRRNQNNQSRLDTAFPPYQNIPNPLQFHHPRN